MDTQQLRNRGEDSGKGWYTGLWVQLGIIEVMDYLLNGLDGPIPTIVQSQVSQACSTGNDWPKTNGVGTS